MNGGLGDVSLPLNEERLSDIIQWLRMKRVFGVHHYIRNITLFMRLRLSIQNVPDFARDHIMRREDYLNLISMLPDFPLGDLREILVKEVKRGLEFFMCFHNIQPESSFLMDDAQRVHDAILKHKRIGFFAWWRYVVEILKERYNSHPRENAALLDLSVDEIAENFDNFQKLSGFFDFHPHGSPDLLITSALTKSYGAFRRIFEESRDAPIDFPLDFDYQNEWKKFLYFLKHQGMKHFMEKFECFNKYFRFLSLKKCRLSDSIVDVKHLIDVLSTDFQGKICEKGMKFASKIKRVLEWYLKKEKHQLMMKMGLVPSPLSSLGDISDFYDEDKSQNIDSLGERTVIRTKAKAWKHCENELEKLAGLADSPVPPPMRPRVESNPLVYREFELVFPNDSPAPPPVRPRVKAQARIRDLEIEKDSGIADAAQTLLDMSNPVEAPLPPELGRGRPVESQEESSLSHSPDKDRKRKRRGLHGRRPAGDGGWGGRLDYDSESD